MVGEAASNSVAVEGYARSHGAAQGAAEGDQLRLQGGRGFARLRLHVLAAAESILSPARSP